MRILGNGIWGLACCAVYVATAPVASAGWSLKQATTGSPGCALESGDITIHDGYQDTRVRLNINDRRLLVLTESNIDSGFGDIELQVDGNPAIPPDTVADEQNVLFKSDVAAIIEQFRKGSKASIHLRFWPSYPATQRYPAGFSLMGFTRAWNAYLECRNETP